MTGRAQPTALQDRLGIENGTFDVPKWWLQQATAPMKASEGVLEFHHLSKRMSSNGDLELDGLLLSMNMSLIIPKRMS